MTFKTGIKYLDKVLWTYRLNVPFFSYLGKKKTFLYLFFCIAVSLLNTLNYIALFPLFSAVSETDEALYAKYYPKWLSFDSGLVQEHFFLILIVFIVLLYLIKFVMGLIISYLAGLFGEGYMISLREKLYLKFVFQKKQRNQSGKADFLYEVSLVPKVGGLNWSFINLNIKILTSVLAFIFIVKIYPVMALVSSLFILFWAFILAPVLKIVRKKSALYIDRQKKLNHFFLEQINCLDLLDLFKAKDARNRLKDKIFKEILQSNISVSVSRQASVSIQEVLVVFFIILILLYSRAKGVSVIDVVTFGFIFSRILNNLNEASSYLSASLEVLPAAEALNQRGVLEVLAKSEKKVSFHSPELNKDIFKLEMKNFKLTSSIEGVSVKPISLALVLGDRLQIKGRNGLGKSSLLKALVGILPFDGNLFLNKEEISSGLTDYINVGFVFQQEMFFEGSVMDNIVLFDESKKETLAKILQDIELNLDEVFEKGIDSFVFDNGENLSGGQKQIINVLRALVTKSRVLILDEYSNHLSEGVLNLFNKFFEKLDDVIIIVVSHSAPPFINKVLVLEEEK